MNSTELVRVNALLRTSLISTEEQDNLPAVIWRCQCPSSGFSHFYWTLTFRRHTRTMCVNALLRASLISTSENSRPKMQPILRVNALLRASLISTVPSGTPLFIRLPSLIFASNSQNILIIQFFRRFFWLVLFRHKILRYLPILLIRSHAI